MALKVVVETRRVREMLVEWLREDASQRVLQEIYNAHFDEAIEIEPEEGLFVLDYKKALELKLIP